MKQRSVLWQWAGFAVATFGGTILHFLYDWTGGSILVAPFSGVNESTWEQAAVLATVSLRPGSAAVFKDQENYWCVKLAGIVLGLVLIPVLFYTYNGVFGKSPEWINIAIFYITALMVFLFEWWAFKDDRLQCKYPRIAVAVICLIGVLFVMFTFIPPQIPLFQDPLTGTYGV